MHVSRNRSQTNSDVQGEAPRQGDTIKTYLLIQRSKIFSGAAWKTRKVPYAQGRVKTWLRLCQFCRQNLEEEVMIHASTSTTSSSLLAEAATLLLATQVAAQVEVHGVTFLTVNLTLAKAASSPTITDTQVQIKLVLLELF
jgi:hypothetical protein